MKWRLYVYFSFEQKLQSNYLQLPKKECKFNNISLSSSFS